MCLSLSLTNGTISYSDSLGVDSVATHSCDTNYTLNGDITRTCQNDGTWSGLAPTCEGIHADSIAIAALLNAFGL